MSEGAAGEPPGCAREPGRVAGEAAVLRLDARDVRKAFGSTQALGGVSLAARAGEIHAIVGENGAGKSTLMSVLAGASLPDGGSMWLDGEPYAPRDPLDGRRRGVGMVYQELSLCPHLTVAENLFLGAEPTTRGRLDRRRMERDAASVLTPLGGDEAGSPLRPDARVRDLPPAAQQLVEIARALSQPAFRLLILDEPTSSLAAGDVERLFDVLRVLRDRGLTVLYISHVLEEVRALAGAFTVLRDGRAVGTGPIASVTDGELIHLMAGRHVVAPAAGSAARRARGPEAGEVVLAIDRLSGITRPESATLDLRRGEITGIAGLVGAGRTELLRAVFGLDRVRSGEVRVGAYAGPASPAQRLAQGIGLVSEDRKGEGLAQALSIADNLTLSKLTGLGPAGLVLASRQRRAAQRWLEELGVRCREPGQPVRELSGGNQQKVAIARLLHQEVSVLLLDEPTRGIDVGSRAQIHALLLELAASGKAILVVSSYLPELFAVCDRIAVMCRGRLGPARPVAELDEHRVLAEATQARPASPPAGLPTADDRAAP